MKGQLLGVTGSRHWTDVKKVEDILSRFVPRPRCIIHGGASKGVDAIAAAWARKAGIPCAVVRPINPAIPGDYIRRNVTIVDLSTQVIAFRAEGKSNGTDFTIKEAEKQGKLLTVIKLLDEKGAAR